MALDLSRLDACLPDVSRSAVPLQAPITMFEEDAGQPRIEFPDDAQFAALTADIAARGLLQPIVVRRLDDGRLRIRFGARRYRAALRAGLKTLPYVETDDERQFDDYAQVAENQHRQALQPLELGRFVLGKLTAGETRRAVAARLEMDPSAVTHLLALAHDPPPLLLELYHSRRCRSPYYLYLLRKLMRRDGALVAQAVAESDNIDLALIAKLTAVLSRPAAPPAALDQPLAKRDRDLSMVASADGCDPRPADAKQRKIARTSSKFPSIRLIGCQGKRRLELLLEPPSMPQYAWVCYEDNGERTQIALATLTLTELLAGMPDKEKQPGPDPEDITRHAQPGGNRNM